MRERDGVDYYYCDGIGYRPAYQDTDVVYIVDDIDAGANTDVAFKKQIISLPYYWSDVLLGIGGGV